MKKYIFSIISIFLLLNSTSCSDFLDENPKNFESIEGVYTNTTGFNTALNGMFAFTRMEFQGWNTSSGVDQGACAYEALQAGLDIVYSSTADNTLSAACQAYGISGTTVYVKARWKWAYGLINNANIMLIQSEKNVAWDNPKTDKEFFQANARFLRAYAYRYLVYLYGDVPWVTAPQESFKVDFERTPKAEVLKNMIEDLEFAAKYLPADPSKVKDGELTKWVALHMLSEICIAAGNYDRAISAANEVIGSKYFQLIKKRFGKSASLPGDYYSDMFTFGNHNRSGGNTESLWVLQAEYNVEGGGGAFNDWTKRAWVPSVYQIPGFIISKEYGGRGVGQIYPIKWLLDSYEDKDVRNSAYNIRREFYYNNPKTPDLFGKKHTITEDDMTKGRCYQTITKFDYGIDIDPSYNGNDKDKIRFRLAETYLLLAEAYIQKGDKTKAAEAINTVRERANATPVEASAVTIDYLLDERARELIGEEMRRFTLARTGKILERTKKYNEKSKTTIEDRHQLWPIPEEVIDANTGLKWQNNPGY